MDYPKVKTSLYLPSNLLGRARLLAERQDRTLSQVLARAIKVGLDAELHHQEEYERDAEARLALMLRPAY